MTATQAPTPGPLDSESVKLLVKGDLLRCINPHTVAVKEGEIRVFERRTHNEPGAGNDIVLSDSHLGTWSGIFAFIGRPDESGWMPWSGGEPTITDPTVDIEVRLRNGELHVDRSPAFDWTYDPEPHPFDIIAFRLAPTAPVEASGSEREHGPKCWGMTSASDEMAHCYCGSTDIRTQTREAVARIVDPAAFLFKADELMKGDTSQYDAFNKADRILALVRPAPVASGGQHSSGEVETLRVLLDNLVIAQALSKDIRQKATDEARSYLYDLRHAPAPAPVASGPRSPDAPCSCFGDSGLQASTHHDADDKERCDLCGGLVEAPVAEMAGEAVAKIIRKGFSTGSLSWTQFGQDADLPDETLLYASPVPAQDDDKLRIAVEALPYGTYQESETVTATAKGDETFAELRKMVAETLPEPFKCAGGMERIRKGDPVLGSEGKTYDYDLQAHVAFVAHHPRQALAALKSTAAQEGGE